MHCGGRRRRARHFEPRIGLAFARRALGPERVERRLLLWRRLLRRLADLARTEQEIEPRLPGLDGSRTRRSRHRLDLRRRLDMMRGVLAVRRQRHRLLLGLRHDLVRPRDARAQAFDRRSRHLDGRARRGGGQAPRRRRGSNSLTTSCNGLAGDRLGRRCRQLDPRRTRGGGRAESWGPFSAAVTRASSVTTADRPTSRSPPTTAKAPAKISVPPRLNSLIGMPNPTKAPPAAASSIPSTSRITDITTNARPNAPQPQPKAAMVSK